MEGTLFLSAKVTMMAYIFATTLCAKASTTENAVASSSISLVAAADPS